MTRELDNRPFKKTTPVTSDKQFLTLSPIDPSATIFFHALDFDPIRVSRRARDSSRVVLSPTKLKIRASCENNGRLSSKHFGSSND